MVLSVDDARARLAAQSTTDRAEDVTESVWGPDGNAVALPDGSYAVNTVEELQSAIAELAADPSIHQNANQGALLTIINHLKNRARVLNVEGLIPPAWNVDGTVIAPRGTTNQPEQRTFCEFEVREQADGSAILAGYASTFNQPYGVRDNYGEFNETILPGAWARTLAERGSKIHLLVGHGALPIPLASTRAGTLKLYEDGHGLGYEAVLFPNDAPDHRNVMVAVQKRNMDEMSVGMRIPPGGDRWSADQSERHISEASLIEISVLPRGANPNTEAFMREDELVKEIRRLETMLTVRTGMSVEAAQRQLASRYVPTAASQARRALLDALK